MVCVQKICIYRYDLYVCEKEVLLGSGGGRGCRGCRLRKRCVRAAVLCALRRVCINIVLKLEKVFFLRIEKKEGNVT